MVVQTGGDSRVEYGRGGSKCSRGSVLGEKSKDSFEPVKKESLTTQCFFLTVFVVNCTYFLLSDGLSDLLFLFYLILIQDGEEQVHFIFND